MSVRIKTLIVICLTFLTLLGILFFISQWFLLKDAISAEEKSTTTDVTRLQHALDDQIAMMDSNVGDWAPWDDTYNFISSGDTAYIDSNLPNVTFTNLGVELMLFINNTGQIVFGKMIDLESEIEIPIPESLYSQLQAGSLLLSHKDLSDKLAGILSLPEGPMIIASQPIVTSQGEGPIRGTLIMGRRLDEGDIAKLSQKTQLSISVYPYNDEVLPGDAARARNTLAGVKSIYIAPQSETVISGYTLVNDVSGNPALILRIDAPRELYTQAKMSVRYIGLALLAIGIVLSLVTMLLLEKMVIVRLTRFTSGILKIGSQGTASSRVEANGNDEIAVLATSVNSMLDSLENSLTKERESEKKFHDFFNNAGIGMFRTRLDGSEILDMNEKFLAIFGRTRSEMKGSASVLHWADLREREEMVRRLEAEGQVNDFECGMLNKQGEMRRCLTSIRLCREEGILEGSILDITERKQMEEALHQSEAELRALFASMRDVVLVIDRGGVYRKIAPTNPGWLVKPPQELIGKTLRDVFPTVEAEIFISVVQQVLDTKQPHQIEYALNIGDRTVQFEASVSPMTEDRTLWVAHDITKRKRSELVQHAIFRLTQAALTSEGIDILYQSIHSTLGELIPAENFFIALYDSTSNQISFPYYVDQYDEPPPGPIKLEGLTGYVIRTGRPLLATREVFDRLVGQGEVEKVGTVGEDWMGAPLQVEGRMIGVMAVQSYTQGIHFYQEDLDLLEFVSNQVAQAIERKRMEEEIRSLSLTDDLTGLYNRRGFTLLADQELKLAYRFKRSVLLFFCDVDSLKAINDTHGHAAGDMALKEVSAILKETFRESDILSRLGGDEFVVLAPDASMENAGILSNRVQTILKRRDQQGDRPYHLTLSIGFARCDPEAPCTLSDLITQADALMYKHKQDRK
jgi:diguanylate cyclase (GGDEF)-like protein/PAS domain S-box-containing protein